MKWLHISDVHFKELGYDTEKLRSSLLEKLGDMNLGLDFILVTGDCFYRNSASDETINNLKLFLKDIGKKCGVVNNKIFICPGNHDVNRKDEFRNKKVDEIRDKGEISDEDFRILEELGGERFRLLYFKLKGSNKKYKTYNVIEPKDLNVRIVVINTTLLSKDDSDYQKLRVCAPQLAKLEKKIKDDEKLNIVMLHHGIEWLHPDDARKFEHWMEDRFIDAVFCGHTHRAAIYTLNDVNRNILQFTSGALLFDNYAYPSFYICEGDTSSISVSLYTFSKDTETWSLDTHHLRKFTSGTFVYNLNRRHSADSHRATKGGEIECINKKERQSIIGDSNNNNNINGGMLACDELIEGLNQQYNNKFSSTKIYSNKSGEKEDFNAWKIVNSLASVDIPYSVALRLTCEVVSSITSNEFPSENVLESSRIKQIVYNTILQSRTYIPGLSEYDIGIWASNYARHYDKETGVLINDNGRLIPISYALLKSTIMKNVVVSITGNEMFYEKIFSGEKAKMASQVMRFIKSLGIFEIRNDILIELIVEYVTERPHPWFVFGDVNKTINYHLTNAANHLNKLENKVDGVHPIHQIEATYHLCAALLANYDPYVGCSEISPLIILKNSLKYKDIQDDKNLPIFRYKLVQMEKDIEMNNQSFDELIKAVEMIYQNIVIDKIATKAETVTALIKIRDIIVEIQKGLGTSEILYQTVFKRVYDVFCSGTGFMVKKPLRQFDDKAFYVKPFWKMEEKEKLNLGDDMFVCMLDGVDDNGNHLKNDNYNKSRTLEEILPYLSQTRKHVIREIVLFKDTLKDFSSDERRLIREQLKNKKMHKRCVFIQESDFHYINTNDWREELIRVILKSRYSY